jgi:NAD(P)-dependent dehydrogenase (short-subunit alcohol dehydrogenase family)
MFDFADQVVIVTGAAGNLGRAVAEAFQAAGARLVLVDRQPDRLQQLFPELAGSPDHYLAAGVDLTDEIQVQAMVQEALGRLGRVDVLVNAAGGYRAGTPVHDTPLRDWAFMMDLNAKTAFVASRAVVPAMLAQGSGAIVSVGSRAAEKGSARAAAYAASKAAVVRLTESLSAELKTKGVRVNCILPGTIDTPQNREAMPRADTSKWVSLEALADTILFLASEAARGIHGAALPVYGTG